MATKTRRQHPEHDHEYATMTVKDLREALAQFPDDARVTLNDGMQPAPKLLHEIAILDRSRRAYVLGDDERDCGEPVGFIVLEGRVAP